MKLLGLVSTLALQANAQTMFGSAESKIDQEIKAVKNRFGNIETVLLNDTENFVSHKLIELGGDSNHYYFDYEQQANHLNDLTSYFKGEKTFKQPEDQQDYTCHSMRNGTGPDPHGEFMFAPAFTGQLSTSIPSHEFEGNCFESIKFDFHYDQSKPDEAQVVATLGKKRSLTCSDFFLMANTEIVHVENFLTSGTHTLTFKASGKDAVADLAANGIETYLFCENLQDELLSVITTVKAFVGGLGLHGKISLFEPKVPEYMEKANLDFMKWALNIEYEERKIQKVEIDDSEIHSGDYFAVMRLDGLDPMIMYGTGSRSGHSVVALRMEGNLYIVESQDAWYWPVHRIQRTLFSEWIKNAENCDFHVVHMPLNDEMRAKFNETAAIEWFKGRQGLPYGYHNFLYSWIDTPEQNWPMILPKDLVPVAFAIIERFDKNLTDTFFTQSLNFKLNKTGLSIPDVAAAAAAEHLNVSDIMARVEMDGWKYQGQYHDGESYVCSCFVAGIWKAAGLYDGYDIQVVEWSPKDVYQVDFFSKTYKRPKQCVEADPDSQFCQLLGKYRMTFPGWSSLKLYDNMNNKCPSVAPDFVRPDGC